MFLVSGPTAGASKPPRRRRRTVQTQSNGSDGGFKTGSQVG